MAFTSSSEEMHRAYSTASGADKLQKIINVNISSDQVNCHTTLSDDIEVFSSVEYFTSNAFQKEWNGVMADCVMLLPICADSVVKNEQLKLTFLYNSITTHINKCSLHECLEL